ncbi:hypothetical protein IW252_001308 [Zhihengliuella flava]|uniref:Uncharacterized protein n=1 Tax=Zhihengliuella flava TaxID=1285193 RepID=A0A931DBL1_9MICC|nr:hypothetical protein [Zhihengliuella flava]
MELGFTENVSCDALLTRAEMWCIGAQMGRRPGADGMQEGGSAVDYVHACGEILRADLRDGAALAHVDVEVQGCRYTLLVPPESVDAVEPMVGSLAGVAVMFAGPVRQDAAGRAYVHAQEFGIPVTVLAGPRGVRDGLRF